MIAVSKFKRITSDFGGPVSIAVRYGKRVIKRLLFHNFATPTPFEVKCLKGETFMVSAFGSIETRKDGMIPVGICDDEWRALDPESVPRFGGFIVNDHGITESSWPITHVWHWNAPDAPDFESAVQVLRQRVEIYRKNMVEAQLEYDRRKR